MLDTADFRLNETRGRGRPFTDFMDSRHDVTRRLYLVLGDISRLVDMFADEGRGRVFGQPCTRYLGNFAVIM